MKKILFGAFLCCFCTTGTTQHVDSIAFEQVLDSLANLGIQLQKSGNHEEEIRIARLGADMILKRFGEQHPDYTAFLHAEGIGYTMMDENEKALPILLRARETRERTFGKENDFYLNHLLSLYLINRNLENYEEAERYIRESLVLNEKMSGRESARYRTALNYLSHFLRGQRRFSESDSCFQELIGLQIKFHGQDHPEVGRISLGRAFMLRDWGRFEAAEQQLATVLAICAKHPEQTRRYYPEAATCIGMIYAETYRLDLAEQYYRKALDGYAMRTGKNSSNYAIALDNLGNLYNSLGLYAQDIALKEEALSIMRIAVESEDPHFIRMLTNTASTYGYMFRLDTAETLLREAELRHEQSSQKDIQNACQIPFVWGNLLIKKGAYEKAEIYQSKATEMIRSTFGTGHPYFITSTLQEAEILLALGKHSKSAEKLIETRNGLLNQMGRNNIDYADYLGIYTDLLFATGQRDSVPNVLEEYSSLLKKLIRQGAQHLSEQELAGMNNHFQNYSFKIFSYTHSDNTARNTLLPATCFNQTLFDKGFLLNASLRLRHLAFEDTTTAQMYRQLLEAKRYLSAQYVIPLAERQGVDELEQKVEQLEKALVRQAPGYKNAIQEVSWQEVQQQLPSNAAAIEWVRFRYQTERATDSILYAALLLLPGAEQPRFIPLFEEKSLDSLLQTQGARKSDYVNHLYSLADRSAKPLNKPQKNLYDLLWQPLEQHLALHFEGQEGLTIYYSPSGLLHRLNLAAIPIGLDSVLGDRHHLVELGSTRQLVVPNQIKPAANDAILFGGISYDSDSTLISQANTTLDSISIASRGELHFAYTDSTLRTGVWSALPFTDREVRGVETTLKAAGFKTDTRKGYAATEEAFKSIGAGKPSPRVLHVATHGFFFPDPKTTSARSETSSTFAAAEPVVKLSNHPMIRSGLILAGANHAWATGKPLNPNMEDGVLTAYEISQMNLSNTELVVLSACETGLGDIQGNEGVYGLQRAFKIAGAKYLIMSLWQVPDKQTSLLMTTFYKKWLEEKMAIPEAFRAAQKELREAGLDPYYWAGFVLVE